MAGGREREREREKERENVCLLKYNLKHAAVIFLKYPFSVVASDEQALGRSATLSRWSVPSNLVCVVTDDQLEVCSCVKIMCARERRERKVYEK